MKEIIRFPTLLAILCTALCIFMPAVLGEQPQITVTPNVTNPGSVLKLTGSNLPSKTPYDLHIDGAFIDSGITLLNGTLKRDLTLPRTIGLGNHTLNLTSAEIFAIATFKTIQWPASISVTPNITNPGRTITISVTGFPPNAAYWIYLDGEKIASGATDDAGNFSIPFSLSKMIALGIHNISANATQYTGPPSARCVLDLVQWPVSVAVDPQVTNPGRSVNILGDNFPPWALYEIHLDGNLILNGQTDINGVFERSYSLAKTLSLGNHNFSARAIDHTGMPTGIFTIQLVQWPVQLSVEPPSARSGEFVAIQGNGFPPNSDFKIYLDGQQIRFGTTNGLGEFQVTYLLPKSTSIGTHELLAEVPGYYGPPSVGTNLQVTEWEVQLEVSPQNPYPGTAVTINGTGYPPSSICHIYLDSQLVQTITASNEGSFLRNLQLGKDISLESHNISGAAVNYAGPPTAADTFEATQWPLSLFTNSTNVTKGSVLALNGSGFPPLCLVRVYWDGSDNIKAGTTSSDGKLFLEVVINYASDESYHALVVNATDSYTGPPSVTTHLWLGSSPPNMTINVHDENDLRRSEFFWGEPIYTNGSGFPPETRITLVILDELPPTGDKVSPVSSTSIMTDSQGRIPETHLWSGDRSGNFSIFVDVNSNLILDNSDMVVPSSLVLKKRPDIAIVNIQTSNDSPVQGESVDISVTVANQGETEESFNVTVRLDSLFVGTEGVVGLGPGQNQTLHMVLGTHSIEVGAYNLTAMADIVDNETDTTDNMAWTLVEVLTKPDIVLESISPSVQTLRVGEVLRVSVSVRNVGERPESFNLSLLADAVPVMTHPVERLQPGSPLIYEFVWNTSQENPRNFSLSVSADPIPYETVIENNIITYGTIMLMAPNIAPVADPNGPYTGMTGVEILFDASRSFDLDGTILSYDWDFGDSETGSGRTVLHAYWDTGVYVVTLSVADNEGAISSQTTNCTIAVATYNLNISVIDIVTGEELVDVLLQVGSENFTLSGGYTSMNLVEGEYEVMAYKEGFLSAGSDISLTDDVSLHLTLTPVCSIWTSNSTGSEKNVYSWDETVFLTIFSPARYPARVYIVADAQLHDGQLLSDATGLGFGSFTIGPGQSKVPIWRSVDRNGDFKVVLDLDANGLLNTQYDVIDTPDAAGFNIAEGAILLAALNAMLLVGRTIICCKRHPS